MYDRKCWGNLKSWERIVCPKDGQPELVTRIERRRDGTVFVRTDRHDHFRQTHTEVITIHGDD